MTTVDDKLKLFAKIVFDKVEKDSEQRVMDFTKSYDQLIEEEKQNIIKQSENVIKQMKKKAESIKSQIVSKANIDMQHALLKKRREIFDRVIADIKQLAHDFTTQVEYTNFLNNCISNCLTKIDADDVILYFSIRDIESYRERIQEVINECKRQDMQVMVDKVDKDIIGGCICEDKARTIRIDCSIASLIDDNKSLIGKMLMDNLQ